MNTIEKDTLLEEIKNTINSIKDDLKAEVIISEILEQIDSKEQNILVDYKGQFKRPYRKDVLGAELINYNYDLTEYVKINLSRDGIYDTLPESLIHELSSEKPQKTVSDMTEQFKAHKKEEEYARKFFFPFENEFFIKALERENIEKEILLELNGSKPLDFFYDFWHIDRDLPPILVSKLIRILPYLHKIVGNLQMTVNCLSYLLDEKVEIAEQGYKEQSSSEQEINLGESRLGLDMISFNSKYNFRNNHTNMNFKTYFKDLIDPSIIAGLLIILALSVIVFVYFGAKINGFKQKYKNKFISYVVILILITALIVFIGSSEVFNNQIFGIFIFYQVIFFILGDRKSVV